MIGTILGHKVTMKEDKRFSEEVYSKIAERLVLYERMIDDKDRYNVEERLYFSGKYAAYCRALGDLIAREDTSIRGTADAYNEIVQMLDRFALSCVGKR